ncbi:MAG: tetratricopeptide repeat family protein [Bacillales bacterium]|jgi:tetratricopeptide (TPR) repeat protein|nr:tetratricopeptide repeat family protein [Bacillales bacterium]
MNKPSILFIGVIAFCIFSILIVTNEGKKQDKVFESNFVSFKLANDNMSNNPDDAILQLNKLQKILIDDPYFYKSLGTAYSFKGDFNEAIKNYKIAIKKYPAIILDGQFDLIFGCVAYYNKDYQLAKLYLEQAEKVGVSKSSRETLNKMINENNKKLEETNE